MSEKITRRYIALYSSVLLFHSVDSNQSKSIFSHEIAGRKKIELKFNNCTQLMQQLQIEPDTFLFFFCCDLLNHAKNRRKILANVRCKTNIVYPNIVTHKSVT